MGGVLFIDEAYYLYRQENERDYGQEAIEIPLQVMENNRDDLVVVLAGYADKMDRVLPFQPGVPLARRPSHRFSRLRRLRSPGDRGENARFSQLQAELRRKACTRRIYRTSPDAAAVRQCAFNPQRVGSRAPASSQPALCSGGPAIDDRHADHNRGRIHPQKPRVSTIGKVRATRSVCRSPGGGSPPDRNHDLIAHHELHGNHSVRKPPYVTEVRSPSAITSATASAG
jgi:hypothetical protein